MSKTSKYTGASFTSEELADPELPATIEVKQAQAERARAEEVDKSSAGSNYLQSQKNESPDNELQEPSGLPPVQRTESLSTESETEDFDASSADGNSLTTEMDSPEYGNWDYPTLQKECKNRGPPATGSQETLVTRLFEYDASQL